MKRPLNSVKCQMELVGVLTREIPTRLVEVSRSGCLLECGHRIEEGTVGALRLEVDGQTYREDVRATRCVAVAGSGSSYLVGVEFLQTARPDGASIRRAISSMSGSLNERFLGSAGLS
jgi:PilZ domain